MKPVNISDDTELQRILWATFAYWKEKDTPPTERLVCYSWILRKYKQRFKTEFHHSRLSQLEKLGFLEKSETSRAGHRRYYKIVNPERVTPLLTTWKL